MSHTGYGPGRRIVVTDETPFDHAYAAIYGEFGVDDETATLYAESVIDYFALPSCPFRIVPVSALPTPEVRAAITTAVEIAEWATAELADRALVLPDPAEGANCDDASARCRAAAMTLRAWLDATEGETR